VVRRAAAIVFVLLLVGCGTTSGKRAGHSAATGTATTADCQPITTRGFSKSEEAVGGSLLTSVEVEGLPCSDRVVFGFRDNPGEPPGFYASYQPASTAKIEDGSGRRIEVAGSSFIVVHLSNAATAEVSGDKVTPTYTGPRRIAADGTRFIREVVKTGDFENQVTWVIGLDSERPFAAHSSGSQVVVDVG
jgi:hypothetical protein